MIEERKAFLTARDMNKVVTSIDDMPRRFRQLADQVSLMLTLHSEMLKLPCPLPSPKGCLPTSACASQPAYLGMCQSA